MLRLTCLVLSLLLSACGGDAPRVDPESAILITLDTTRADALGSYGGRPGLTPNLDLLARESVSYLAAYTVAPLTLPAHASMFTGLYPPRHGVRDNGLAPLPESAWTLAEAARAAGLQTAAFVSSTAVDRAFALDQGFESWEQPAPAAGVFGERPAPEVTRAAGVWLRSRDRKRGFFLWLHYFDAHVPYAPPQSFMQQAGRDPYLAEIAAVDASVGELLAELRADGTLERTLVVVVADHGESRGEHGEPTHGALCYDATMRVPLLVRHPDGWRAGERSHELASVADVFPTVVDALALGAPGDIDGISLFRRQVPDTRGVYLESLSGWLDYGWSPLAGWVDAEGKYLHSSQPELYAPRRDPAEQQNLILTRAADAQRYRGAIATLLARPGLDAVEHEPFEAELLRALRALGYAATGAPPEELPDLLAPSVRPSPRDRAQILEPLLVASALLDARRGPEAVPALEAILAENSGNALAGDMLGLALMEAGRFEQARGVLEGRLSLGAPRVDTLINLGLCLERVGEDTAALQRYREALAIDPDEAQARELLRGLRERLER